MSFEALTILVPTHERYFYLVRLLEYFDTRKIRNLKIIILDSSTLDLREKVISKDYKNLTITQIFFDHEISFWNKISRGFDSVESEFSVLCPDDDFLIMSGLKKAIKFLCENPVYSSCGGRQYNHYKSPQRILIRYKFNLIYGENTNFNQSDNPLIRIKEYIAGNYKYYSFYHVHRSNHHKEIWASTKKYVSDFGLSELYPCSASLIIGKIKVLDAAYMSREPNRFAWADSDRIEKMYSSSKIQSAADGLSILIGEKRNANREIFNIFQDYKKRQMVKFDSMNKEKKNRKLFIGFKEKLAIRSRVYSMYYKILDTFFLIRAYKDILPIIHLINKYNVSENQLKKSRESLYRNNTN